MGRLFARKRELIFGWTLSVQRRGVSHRAILAVILHCDVYEDHFLYGSVTSRNVDQLNAVRPDKLEIIRIEGQQDICARFASYSGNQSIVNRPAGNSSFR